MSINLLIACELVILNPNLSSMRIQSSVTHQCIPEMEEVNYYKN